jgi:hypothetical protein
MYILSRVWVTIDGVLIGDSIYWPIVHSRLVTTLYRSLTHTDKCPQSITFSINRFLATDFNTESMYNSLTELHTPDITHKVFSSQPDFQLSTLESKYLSKVRVKVKVTVWVAIYRQSFRLGVKPPETNNQRYFFFQLSPCGNSPYVRSSLMRRWVTNYMPQTVPVIISRHGPRRKHRSSVAVPLLRSCLLLRERVYRATG